MRRRLIFVIPLVICLIAASATALNIGKFYPAKSAASGALATFTWTAANPFELPSGVTLYTKDGSAFYVKRSGDEGFFPMPANNSILTPLPSSTVSGDSFQVVIYAAGHADSVIALGWK